jgi:hypothetical protein
VVELLLGWLEEGRLRRGNAGAITALHLARLEQLPEIKGCKAKLRLKPNSTDPYVTDNANYIIDLYFETPIKDANAAGKVSGVAWSFCFVVGGLCDAVGIC